LQLCFFDNSPYTVSLDFSWHDTPQPDNDAVLVCNEVAKMFYIIGQIIEDEA